MGHAGLVGRQGAASLHGTQAQKEALLPKVASGELQFAFAMTEPGGGTDVLRAMRTRATRADGGWVINGTKVWSTLAHVADKVLVVARTSDGAKPSRGLTMFLVDGRADGPGGDADPQARDARARFVPGLAHRRVRPDEDVLGEVDQGWKQVLASLNSERIMVAALCTGILEGVLEDAVAYASERHAFGKPIGQMQAVQHKIADIAMNLETCRLHTHRAAWLEREGRPCGVEATIAKCLTAEYATRGRRRRHPDPRRQRLRRRVRHAALLARRPVDADRADHRRDVRNYVGESLGLPRVLLKDT